METLKLSILKNLYFKNPQSIADLSLNIGKSLPNITSAVNKLMEGGYISQDGLAPSTGGRRAAQFVPVAESLPIMLCVAVDQLYTSAVLTDFNNQFITPIKTKEINLKSESAYQDLKELIELLIKTSEKNTIYGIGLTIPGFVDSNSGKNNSYSLDSPLYDLKTNLERDLHLPVFVENDSSAIAIAEHRFGVAHKSKNVMVVNLNWGVGLGMILDNELYRGHSGYAGEFSHIPLSNTNKLCSCGKKGCLEVEASLLAAVEFAIEKLKTKEVSSLQEIYSKKQTITGDQLLNAALEGDQLAIESIRRIGFMLGKGIATLIHIINPEQVVISGRGAKAQQILLPQVQSALLEFSIQRLSKHTKVEFSQTNHIQLLGSACVVVGNADRTIYKQITKIN